jgi:hypothetical protein
MFDINTEELLSVIQEALDNTDAEMVGFTRLELQQLMGWSEYKTLKVVHILVEKGLARSVYAQRPNIHGIMSGRPAFELTPRPTNDNM